MSQSRLFRKLSLIVLSLILYTVVGGVLFFYVENCIPSERSEHAQLTTDGSKLLSFCEALLSTQDINTSQNNSWSYKLDDNSSIDHCVQLASNLTKKYSYEAYAKNCSFNIKTFMPWATFATRVIFTVGPGNYSPRSTLGQSILILYCTIGIPWGMLMLYYAGRFTSGLFFYLITFIEYHAFDHHHIRFPEKKVVLLSCVTLVAWILGISSMTASSHFENISYFEAVTKWFMLCTTLGTRVNQVAFPGDNVWGWKDIITNISLSIGLSLTATFALSSIVLICSLKGQTKRPHGLSHSSGNDQIETNPVCFAETGY